MTTAADRTAAKGASVSINHVRAFAAVFGKTRRLIPTLKKACVNFHQRNHELKLHKDHLSVKNPAVKSAILMVKSRPVVRPDPGVQVSAFVPTGIVPNHDHPLFVFLSCNCQHSHICKLLGCSALKYSIIQGPSIRRIAFGFGLQTTQPCVLKGMDRPS